MVVEQSRVRIPISTSCRDTTVCGTVQAPACAHGSFCMRSTRTATPRPPWSGPPRPHAACRRERIPQADPRRPTRQEGTMASPLVDRRDMDFVLYEQLTLPAHERRHLLTSLRRLRHGPRPRIRFAQNDLAPTNADGDQTCAQWKDGKVTLPSFHGPLHSMRSRGGWPHRGARGGGQGSLLCSRPATSLTRAMAMSQYMTRTHGAALLIKFFFGTEDQKRST